MISCAVLVAGAGIVSSGEWVSGIRWAEPVVVTPGTNPGDPPCDALVLFDGKSLDQFQGGEKWVIENGYAIAKGGGFHRKRVLVTASSTLNGPLPKRSKAKARGEATAVFI